MRSLNREIRTQASILIERWSDGKLFVVKNRFEDRKTPYQIHPNEAMKLMGKYNKVVITNWDVSGEKLQMAPKVSWYVSNDRSCDLAAHSTP